MLRNGESDMVDRVDGRFPPPVDTYIQEGQSGPLPSHVKGPRGE